MGLVCIIANVKKCSDSIRSLVWRIGGASVQQFGCIFLPTSSAVASARTKLPTPLDRFFVGAGQLPHRGIRSLDDLLPPLKAKRNILSAQHFRAPGMSNLLLWILVVPLDSSLVDSRDPAVVDIGGSAVLSCTSYEVRGGTLIFILHSY